MSGIFGGGGGGGDEKVINQTRPYGAAVPAIDQYYGSIRNAFNNSLLRIDPYPKNTLAPLSNQTKDAWNTIAARAKAGSPLNDAASGYIQSVLDPSYLTSDSPGLQSVIDTSRQGVNAEFARAGRTFSGSHAGGLASSEGQLRYQDLARKAAEQQAAAQFAPTLAREDYFDLAQLQGVGQQRDARMQDTLNADINRWNQQQMQVPNALQLYGQLIAGGSGPTSSATTQPVTPSGNPFLQGLGAIGSFASLFA